MILIVDNYDSFTHNLVHLVASVAPEPRTVRNDALTVQGFMDLKPSAVLISPGPKAPSEAGISIALARACLDEDVPLLGVCLGHQTLAAALGGAILRAPRPRHGVAAQVRHHGSELFAGIPEIFEAARYHSLVAAADDLDAAGLDVLAEAEDDGTVMAIGARGFRAYGVQFHPESYATRDGQRLIANFVGLAELAA